MKNDYVGSVAYSKSGRDEGRIFVIIGIINDDYVYISDGDLRTIEKPKRKKIKHLNVTKIVLPEVKKALEQGDKVSNRAIKKYLLSISSSEEV